MTDSAAGERITVVIPTYNERDNLPVLVDQLMALPLPGLAILVVDDNSPDGTGELADKLATSIAGRMDVLHRTAKDGLGRLHVKDATAGFKAWQSSSLRAIQIETIRSNGYSFQVEMNYRTARAGLAITEVPITFSERAGGTSKMTLKVQLESARTPWRLRISRTTRP